jgi:hypothetical protein
MTTDDPRSHRFEATLAEKTQARARFAESAAALLSDLARTAGTFDLTLLQHFATMARIEAEAIAAATPQSTMRSS